MNVKARSWLRSRGVYIHQCGVFARLVFLLDWQANHNTYAPHGLALHCECVLGGEDYIDCPTACGAPAFVERGGLLLCGYCAGDHGELGFLA